MKENMPGDKPSACVAPLPYTLFKTHHVVFRHISLRCDRQVLQHRSMDLFEQGPRPLEEGARAARGGTRHVLGRSGRRPAPKTKIGPHLRGLARTLGPGSPPPRSMFTLCTSMLAFLSLRSVNYPTEASG